MQNPKRVACVDVPALSLQLVLRAHPQWAQDPVVIVTEDRPRAPIVWANRAARGVGIHRGLCFSEAKALSSILHAEVVAEHAIDDAIEELFELLLKLTPHIEPALDQAGLFWIDPSGLSGLFGDLQRWARAIEHALLLERFVSAVVVGFSRGHVLALARSRKGVLVTPDRESEQGAASRVALSKLEIPVTLRDQLALLGIHTVGQMLALPGPQLRLRYGAAAGRLHDFLSGRCYSPLLPREPAIPLVLELAVEPPDDDHNRLLFGLKGVLQRAVQKLVHEHQAVTALVLELSIERHGKRQERVEAAAPTFDVLQLLDLVRLRLSSLSLPGKVEHMRMTVEHVRVHPRQVALHALSHDETKPRDLEAAARALARIRATFGPDAVAAAKLREAHLPEARYALEPVHEVRLPKHVTINPAHVHRATRRVFSSLESLPEVVRKRAPQDDSDTWLNAHGVAKNIVGPDRIAGGWWAQSVERDYYVVETSTGELLWVYHDKLRRRWLLHGVVD
jgi:protein ImuB